MVAADDARIKKIGFLTCNGLELNKLYPENRQLRTSFLIFWSSAGQRLSRRRSALFACCLNKTSSLELLSLVVDMALVFKAPQVNLKCSQG